MTLHPLLRRAAAGELPDWSRAAEGRRRHMARVAALLGDWAGALGLGGEEVDRWRAAGFLHDALRDAEPTSLRPALDGAEGIPDEVLHGPAAAARLRGEGVDDEAVLRAIAFHTLGHPDLDRMGLCLYVADHLEPGRADPDGVRAEMRASLPGRLSEVLPIVAARRIGRVLERGRPLTRETVEFWNRRCAGDVPVRSRAREAIDEG